MVFCPSCGRLPFANKYCSFCGHNTLFSRSGLIMKEGEQILVIFRVLSGTAQIPSTNDNVHLDLVGANVLRLFTYVSGEISKSIRTLYLFGEVVVTTKRVVFIQEMGFLSSKPVVVFAIPIETITAIGTSSPYFQFERKSLLITYGKDEEFYTIDLKTDVDPEKLKKYLAIQLEVSKSTK